MTDDAVPASPATTDQTTNPDGSISWLKAFVPGWLAAFGSALGTFVSNAITDTLAAASNLSWKWRMAVAVIVVGAGAWFFGFLHFPTGHDVSKLVPKIETSESVDAKIATASEQTVQAINEHTASLISLIAQQRADMAQAIAETSTDPVAFKALSDRVKKLEAEVAAIPARARKSRR